MSEVVRAQSLLDAALDLWRLAEEYATKGGPVNTERAHDYSKLADELSARAAKMAREAGGDE